MFGLWLVGAPPALAAHPQIRIQSPTSGIYQYDGYPVPAGETWPAVTVTSVVTRCEGTHAFWATLTQEGVAAELAMFGAMGWASYTCGTGPKSVSFASSSLHPGTAKVTITLGTTEVTRVVRIPG
jgi:hypothetical protein